VTAVVDLNLDDINSEIAHLTAEDVKTADKIQKIVDNKNKLINYLVITVDTEASFTRQSSNYVDRLIYGHFDNGQAGISEMMDIADEVNVDITFFLDVLEEYRYEGQIAAVAQEITTRGHDLQLHAHPKMIPNEKWSLLMPRNSNPNTWSYKEADIMFSAMLDFFDTNKLPRPIAYRAGSYLYNINTLKALAEKNFKTSSNYNEFKPASIQPEPWGHQGAFYWDNGILELPITHSPSKCTNTINTGDRIDESYYEFFTDPWNKMKKNAECYQHPRISIMILHSFSFLYRQYINDKNSGSYYFIFKDNKKVKAFRRFLQSIPEDFKIISMSQLTWLIKEGVIKINHTENLDRINPNL
jgi:hypothetical protein